MLVPVQDTTMFHSNHTKTLTSHAYTFPGLQIKRRNSPMSAFTFSLYAVFLFALKEQGLTSRNSRTPKYPTLGSHLQR
jgi:hypothetical protein